MKRAESYRLNSPGPCANPCDDCGGRCFAWVEVPSPGHNLGALYECEACGSVITLADQWGDMWDLLP